ncbi:translocation/assembly module TamB domain-containing protein [Chitinophagaceae bacterium LWZ2-11]
MVLLIALLIFLQTRTAKNIIRNKLQAYLSSKTHSIVSIGSIDYSLPDKFELDTILWRDQTNDTLFYGKSVYVDISVFKILKGAYVINKIKLDDVYVNLYRKEQDSSYNYQFIIDSFASKTPSPKKDTSALRLSVDEVTLTKVRANMLDYNQGSLLRLSTTELNLKMKELDLSKQIYQIKKLHTDGLNFSMQILKESNPAPIQATAMASSATVYPIVTADDIDVNRAAIYFENKPEGLLSDNKIGRLQAKNITNKKDRNIFNAKSILLDSSNIIFNRVSAKIPAEKTVAVKDTVKVVGNSLMFAVNEIKIEHNNITYNDNAKPKQKKGLDYNHLAITNLNIASTDNYYGGDSIQASIEQFMFTDKSGFTLNELKGSIKMNSDFIAVKNLVLKTPYTTITAAATVYPNSLMSPVPVNSKMPVNDIQLSKTVIGRKDLDLLAEGLSEKYKTQLDELGNLLIDAKLTGDAREMYIRYLTVTATRANTLNVQLSGKLNNVNDTKNIGYDLDVKNITASRGLISPFINSNIQPDSRQINLPSVITVKGKVAGTMNRVNANITTNSEYGFAGIKANLIQFTDVKNISYDVVVNAKNLETGKWIGQDSMLGQVTGMFALKGNKGFDYKHNTMQAKVDLQTFRLNANTLTGINLNASTNAGAANATASIKDALINLDFSAKGNVSGQYPSGDIMLNIVKADLLTLGFTKDSLVVTTFTKLNVDDASPQNLHALLRIAGTVISTSGKKISIDSAITTAKVSNDSTLINLVSPFADADVRSTVYYNHMASLVKEVISRFMPNDSSQNKNKEDRTKGTITADIIIKPNDAYGDFVQGLKMPDQATLKASINNISEDSSIKADLTVPSFQLSGTSASKLRLTALGKGDSLYAHLTADTLKESSILLYDAIVNAGISKNKINVVASTKGENKKEQFKIGANIDQSDSAVTTIHLTDSLLLNYQQWQVNNANLIRLSKEGFNIRAFELTNKGQKIQAVSDNESFGAPVMIDIDDFKISNVTTGMQADSLQVDGLFNVSMKVSEFNNKIPTIDGYVELDSLTYQNMLVGDFYAKARSENGNVVLNGKLYNNGNNVEIAGKYDENNIDVKVNLNPLTMASIQPFTGGALVRSSGNISGPINITGSVSDPKWSGELRFDSVKTTSGQFGTVVKITNQKIAFNYPTITLHNFMVTDSSNNNIVVNGTVTQDQDNDFKTDMTIKATDFMLVNNTDADNEMIYGTAKIDIDAAVKGYVSAPDITGLIKVKKGTDITYVRQSITYSAKDREGVIEFIDMDTVKNLLQKTTFAEVAEIQKQKKYKGSLVYDLNIDIDKEAKVSVIVDPASGDKLQVQGDAQITAGVNPNGSISIVGTYNLHKGSYELHYQVINRTFDLLDGSTVTLSGDPTNAEVDITAAYHVEADALDLAGNELGTSTAQTNTFRGKVPFDVLLKIKGSVTKPQLSFDIKRSDNSEGVNYAVATVIDNKLAQMRADSSEMNKQVFALLIMNKFISEQSSDFFAGSGSNNGNLLANSSVSGFLSEAANQLASDLIKGVDVDINLKTVNEDPTKQHTDLSVGLSKKFMNDRLSVTVGKSFTVDGNDPGINGRTGINDNVQFIPDINTTYKLSRDGKYLLRAYRRTQYEAVLDGYFIETGVAISITIDYDTFKELVAKKKKKE